LKSGPNTQGMSVGRIPTSIGGKIRSKERGCLVGTGGKVSFAGVASALGRGWPMFIKFDRRGDGLKIRKGGKYLKRRKGCVARARGCNRLK